MFEYLLENHLPLDNVLDGYFTRVLTDIEEINYQKLNMNDGNDYTDKIPINNLLIIFMLIFLYNMITDKLK